MKKAAGALLATLLVLTACASEARRIIDDPDASNETAEVPDGSRGDKKDDPKKRTRGGDATGGASDANGSDGEEGEDRGDGDTSTGGSDGGDGGGGGGGGNAAPYPAAGTYTYSQSGYEEFCDSAGNCDKEKLPSRQPVTLTYESRSGSSATVVTEQQASGSRLARTWTRYTPSGAHITKAYVRFEYSGFRFERTYVPEPPVEALRFPFATGEAWSGKWKAATSGSYSAKVGSATTTTVKGREVTAYRVETTTEFRGDFEGKSRVTAYYDPETKGLVAAKGVLNVTSQFGRYTTVFDMKLINAPGY